MEEETKTDGSNSINNDLDFKPTYKVLPLSEEEKKKYNFQSKDEKSIFFWNIYAFFF